LFFFFLDPAPSLPFESVSMEPPFFPAPHSRVSPPTPPHKSGFTYSEVCFLVVPLRGVFSCPSGTSLLSMLGDFSPAFLHLFLTDVHYFFCWGFCSLPPQLCLFSSMKFIRDRICVSCDSTCFGIEAPCALESNPSFTLRLSLGMSMCFPLLDRSVMQSFAPPPTYISPC